MARQWRTITSLEWHYIELAFSWCDSLNDCDWCSPPRQKHCAAKYDELLGYVQTSGGREYEEPSRRADSWENEAPVCNVRVLDVTPV